MTNYYLSDTHEAHAKIIQYCKRPFSNVEEMNEEMIRRWNNVVKPDDHVYHGGDVGFGSAKSIGQWLRRLNGIKHLAIGNHDEQYLNDSDFTDCFESIEWRYNIIEYDPDTRSKERKLILTHEPLLTWAGAHKIDKGGNYRVWHIHGHCHANINYLNDETTRLDIGVDNGWDYTPINFEQIKERLKNKVYRVVDHHGYKNKEAK